MLLWTRGISNWKWISPTTPTTRPMVNGNTATHSPEEYQGCADECRSRRVSTTRIFNWCWHALAIGNAPRTATTGAVGHQSGPGDTTLPRQRRTSSEMTVVFSRWELSPFVTLPTSQDNLGAGSVEGGLGIPYAFDVPNWDVGFQTTFNYDRNNVGSGYHAEIDNSVSIGHAVIGPLEYPRGIFQQRKHRAKLRMGRHG